MQNQTRKVESITLQGVGVSPGIATGEVRIILDAEGKIEERKITEEEIPGEIVRFQDALIATRRQLHDIREHVRKAIDDNAAAIFDGHILIIDDQSFIEKVFAGLRRRKMNVETVLHDVMEEYVKAFSRMEDAYVKERGADLRDLANRVLRNLSGRPKPLEGEADMPAIVVAQDILPSVAATMDKTRVIGIATDMGGHTSHAAIMARALEIPAVVGLDNISQTVEWGDTLLIDGTLGCVVINPSREQLARYGHLDHARQELLERLDGLKNESSETRDGRKIRLRANIELTERVARVQESGAEGVGLFRTEYLFLARPDLPSEDEQVAAYETVARAVHPAPVVIRTLDAGGEKILPHQHMPEQSSSALGCVGIRLSLARPDVFKIQLRAILRAARLGNIGLMYPMVSGADEVIQANDVLRQAVDELHAEGSDFNPNPEIGAMIEIPSAAMTVDLIAPHVSFFSLGTNDLVQYTIAVDRLDQNTAALYEPTHPGVLRLIKQAVELAHKNNTRIAVCGEMAGSPLLVPLLIGLGIEELSVTPVSVPLIKYIIRSIRHEDAVSMANDALTKTTADAVLACCREMIERDVHDMKDLFSR